MLLTEVWRLLEKATEAGLERYGMAVDAPEGAQQLAQHSRRETRRTAASGCDGPTDDKAQRESPKLLQIADLSDGVRGDALYNASSPGGTRTPDQGIMSPLL